MFTQIITPDPNIACKPGWCLQYVRQTYGLDGVHPTATAAWEASPTQHPDRNFPEGVAVPVWYELDNEPAGHVVLRMPNGNVYSTSDNNNTPHLHPDLEDLERYYAYYGMPLTYRGWTEDIENVSVVAQSIDFGGIAAQGSTITPVSSEDELTPDQMLELKLFIQSDNEARHVATRNSITQELSKKIEDVSYGVKVFTQSVDNQNADRVINDAHANLQK